MFEKLGRFVVRFRVATLVFTAAIMAVSIALLLHGGRLTSGSFRGIEAGKAQALVEQVTGHSEDVTFVAIFQSARPGVDLDRAMDDAMAPVRTDEHVAQVVTPRDAPAFLASRMSNEANDTRVAYVTLRGEFPEALAAYSGVRGKIVSPDATVTCTGHLPFMHDMNKTLESDLFRAELVALPLALLVLVLVFRTLVAAALPVGVGGMAVVGGIGIVLALSHGVDVAMYTVNVCSLIGLGVSIDYSLFLVSRYREELGRGGTRDEALIRAVSTAGRTVAFSGLAVCTGLAGLFFFEGSYLLPMGIGGAIVVALAMLFALTFLPALLSVLGERIHAGRLPLPKPKHDPRFWSNVARSVMRRPLLVGLPTLALLVAMGIPFLHLRLAAADVRVLDRTVEARRGYELLKEKLPDQSKNRILVAVEFPSAPALDSNRIDALVDLADRMGKIPHVSGVESLFATNEQMGKDELEVFLQHPPAEMAEMVAQGKALTVGDKVVTLYALTDFTPDTEEARSIVAALRNDRAVADGSMLVGGDTAKDIDATNFIRSRMPRAIFFVVGVTLILLFFVFRSVVLPIKAVLMNCLSMCGSFGALVYIFQDGHFGIREPRPLEPTLPVLLFCVLFGLSMDYEVLLLSRVKEAYLRTGDNTEAVAEGLQKTAGLITSAAAIMVAVFAAFAFAHVVMIQAVGVGMAMAVALDATLVRTLLVPSTMRLMGRLNWWSPKFLRSKKDIVQTKGAHPPVDGVHAH